MDTTHASFGRQHRGFPPPPPNSRHSPPRPLGVGQIPDQLRSTRAVSSGAKPIAPRPRAHTRPAHGHAGRGIRTLPPVLPTPASTSTLHVVGQPHGAASAPSSRPLTCRRSGSGAAAAPLTPRIVTIVLMDFVLRCDMEVAESCERGCAWDMDGMRGRPGLRVRLERGKRDGVRKPDRKESSGRGCVSFC